MKIDFTGQTALVTGGTRGIGKELADQLADLGARVIVTGRSEKGDCPHRLMQVDFENRESTLRFLDLVEAAGRIDVLVNNAGINRINTIDATNVEDWDALRAVNLDAPLLLTRAVSSIMKKNGYGRIVNIASIFGVISKPRRALYSMTKFGLRGLTVASALDLARHGILVNTLSPGFVLTELTRSILSEAEMNELAAEVPLGRFADPAEIARVALFLASRENTYITGQNIVADGGFVNV